MFYSIHSQHANNDRGEHSRTCLMPMINCTLRELMIFNLTPIDNVPAMLSDSFRPPSVSLRQALFACCCYFLVHLAYC